MQVHIELHLEANIPKDRANANEIFLEVTRVSKEAKEKIALAVIEAYEENIIEVLCDSNVPESKEGLGRHTRKGESKEWCQCRTFERAGYRSDKRRLRGNGFRIKFKPAMVKCLGCGKRFSPVLDALELKPYQGRTDELLQQVTEAIADTSYRRGSDQLEILGDVPVPKSTAHRWVATVHLPTNKSRGDPFLSTDGTGFHKQPGQRGNIRLVMEMGEKGGIHPLGVWAGTDWESIAEEVKNTRKDKWKLLNSDGERGIDKRMGPLAENLGRCQWHFARDSSFSLWKDGVPLDEREIIKDQLNKLISIEIPKKDIELVKSSDKEKLLQKIRTAENDILRLQEEFKEKGYIKAAVYLANARKKLFTHLKMWVDTGIIAPKTASLIENIIRELVRRLKKVGWNWSDAGAERIGRIVMIRRYDRDEWNEYWKKRMNLQNRCEIKLVYYAWWRAA